MDNSVKDDSHEPSLNALAKEFGLNVLKIRKLLITAGAYSTATSRKVRNLSQKDVSTEEILKQTDLSRASINSYLPYMDAAYKLPEVSVDADRQKLYRKRKQAVERLNEEWSETALWNAVVVFQGYLFHTEGKGLEFSYNLKVGRDGTFNRELVINRRKESKTLAWNSVMLAFRRAKEHQGEAILRAKSLGDIRGISYVYALFIRWGIVRAEESS